MAALPFVSANLVADAASASPPPPDITCDQLVDLLWFYGARPAHGVGISHELIPHAKDILQPLDANTFNYQSVGSATPLGGSLSAEQGHQQPSQKHQPCTNNIDIARQCHRYSASMEWLRRVFDTFDENKDGLLSLEELRRSFEKLGLESSNLQCLLRGMPVAKEEDGVVSHEDFLHLYHGVSCKQCAPHHTDNIGGGDSSDNNDVEEEGLILDAFNVFDKDKDGFISPTELQSILCNLGFGVAKELDACVQMIRGYDQDGNGQVDYEEFKDMLNSVIMT